MNTESYISKIITNKNKITITPGETLKPFINGDFFVEYESEFDISVLGDEIAVIPFVLATAAIVWCSGESLYIDKLDAKLAESLSKLKTEYAEMYPTINWNGEIIVNDLVTAEPSKGIDGILFSGGLDSIHSAFTTPGNKYLFTIKGADSNLGEEYPWKYMKDHALDFAEKNNQKSVFIYSNFKEFLNESKLHTWHREISHWYSHVQFGPALIGLTAPIMFLGGGNKMYISSGGQTNDLVRGWGSSKTLDESIRYGEVEVHHFGELNSRLEKIHDIVELKRKGIAKEIVLRVCPKHNRGESNCGVCEKCLRTATGLILEGENTQEWGFQLDSVQSLKLLISKLKKYTLEAPAVFPVEWKILQKKANEIEINGELSEYIHWISNFDFKKYAMIRSIVTGRKFYSNSPRLIRKIIRKLYFFLKG